MTAVLISRSIMELEFEWTPKLKPTSKHTASASSLAKTVFQDVFALERLDDREDYGEERFVIIGMAEGNILLFVAYTERGERIRIISARRATQHEQDDYFRQNAQDGSTHSS
ncbi:MAG TPA: BrnT family toxin [Candidatus Angelobacter sp.]|nr:BrnT family toxin [Candidatus Angelobacter sp.]